MARKADSTSGQDLHSLIAAKRLEIFEIELEVAVLQADDLGKLTTIRILAVGREAHNLAFIAILPVADELTDHGVKTAERVRQKHTIQDFDVISFTARHHGRNEVAGAVVAETCGPLPRRAVIGAGDVGHVMLEMMFLKTELCRIDF